MVPPPCQRVKIVGVHRQLRRLRHPIRESLRVNGQKLRLIERRRRGVPCSEAAGAAGQRGRSLVAGVAGAQHGRIQPQLPHGHPHFRALRQRRRQHRGRLAESPGILGKPFQESADAGKLGFPGIC